ncbi:hypothetical protein EVC29_058 [Rhizobium phage RHph_Y52]|nr:hypothetical protein EVC03_056 [Rhizobium phage RHph_Y5A]QIG75287.1 hypothetical protein EVC16_058 [Rhizobium phage RHph_Y21]QIG75498.1 hypothetical protein EVC18_056 [Rhizobium phage RHph_Y2_4]QIG76759.1 hypothetical protein EVC29_058 [Rhizobium phage RHph_Y52]
MSYFEENVDPISEIVGFDASSDAAIPGANRFVTLGSGGVTLTGANAAPYGVLTGNFEQGEAGRIARGGIVPVVVGAGGVTKGSAVHVGANGVAVNGGTKAVGIAVLAGNVGDVVPVRLAIPAS